MNNFKASFIGLIEDLASGFPLFLVEKCKKDRRLREKDRREGNKESIQQMR